MDWGMQNRMSQLIKEDGKCFFLPIDHGYFQGPTHCLEKPGETIEPLLPFCDALFVTRGILRAAVNPIGSKPIILRVSGGTSVVGDNLANESITTSIEEILRLNVAAVGVSIFVGSKYERNSLLNLAELVNQCEEYGIPVMAVTAVGKELEKRDARYLALASRIAAELGADLVKTYYTGKSETFSEVIEACPLPVLLSGGEKTKDPKDFFSTLRTCIDCGARGVAVGRNVWQSEDPPMMLRGVKKIVHENAEVSEVIH